MIYLRYKLWLKMHILEHYVIILRCYSFLFLSLIASYETCTLLCKLLFITMEYICFDFLQICNRCSSGNLLPSFVCGDPHKINEPVYPTVPWNQIISRQVRNLNVVPLHIHLTRIQTNKTTHKQTNTIAHAYIPLQTHVNVEHSMSGWAKLSRKY